MLFEEIATLGNFFSLMFDFTSFGFGCETIAWSGQDEELVTDTYIRLFELFFNKITTLIYIKNYLLKSACFHTTSSVLFKIYSKN